MGNRARLVGLLAALVALNAAFVAALLWAYGVFVPILVSAVFVPLGATQILDGILRFPVSVPVFISLVAASLAAQIYYGYRRVLSGTRGIRGDDEHAVAETVRRLAMTAGVPAPTVRVVDDERPSCYTVGRLTDATIVVTTGLVDRLDGDELAAVLAHELAHVANRDVTLMTIATLFLEVAARTYRGALVVRRAVTGSGDLSARDSIALTWFLPLTVLTTVFVAPVLALFPPLARRATRRLAHAREFAADAAAARLTGQPLALATALVTLADAAPTQTTDLRLSGTRALCILPIEPVTGPRARDVSESEDAGAADLDPDTESDQETDRASDRRSDRLTAWLDAATPAQGEEAGGETHPPIDERIRRLQAIAAELEGAAKLESGAELEGGADLESGAESEGAT